LTLQNYIDRSAWNVSHDQRNNSKPAVVNYFHKQDTPHCVSKKILDINDCNLRRDYKILIIFGTNISDTTGHPVTVQVPTSPGVCSCTTWGNQNKRNITFLFEVIWLFN